MSILINFQVISCSCKIFQAVLICHIQFIVQVIIADVIFLFYPFAESKHHNVNLNSIFNYFRHSRHFSCDTSFTNAGTRRMLFFGELIFSNSVISYTFCISIALRFEFGNFSDLSVGMQFTVNTVASWWNNLVRKRITVSRISQVLINCRRLCQGFKCESLIIAYGDSQHHFLHNQYSGTTGQNEVKGFKGSLVLLSVTEMCWKGDY